MINMAEKRFEKMYSQGALSTAEIWVDKMTGVNYLFVSVGESGGLTVLIDKDGKPVISPEYAQDHVGFPM